MFGGILKIIDWKSKKDLTLRLSNFSLIYLSIDNNGFMLIEY